ncbi:MAG: pyruvate, phosphate dikinase [Planctomycetota bacterium]|jgi:pyruvate,orthophosphate dikinase
MAKKSKFVYFFGGGNAEGKASMKELLGGKGANLADMSSLGLPVPAGFTITCEVCDLFYKLGRKYPQGLQKQIGDNIKKLEKLTGKTFGYGDNPLLVSVRSGAAQSMPGMMDTVLNLGLNDKTLPALIELTGNERFAWDSYRRFMQMFGDVVLDIPHHDFEAALDRVKKKRKAALDTDLCVDGLKEVVGEYKKAYKKAGKAFPQDAMKQLQCAVDAVFGSWNNPRAIKYRQINDMRGLLGTAVNVQLMVFGNMGDTSGTGVAFTRNPSTGENKFYGEYLMNAQGEDVVAGIRTPEPISQLAKVDRKSYNELVKIRTLLEKHYGDMQDLEFTIERGKLYMLQTRNGKRTAAAAVKVAADLVKEKRITEKEAVMRVDPMCLDQLLHPTFDGASEKKAPTYAKGLPASPGAACGQVVFCADEAEKWAAKGKTVILCRTETSPEDIGGMHVAKGILTSRGGMTSHAAVVARGMGTCCVAGAGDIHMDYKAKKMTVGKKVVKEGEWISLNGSTGVVYTGQIKTVDPKLTGPFAQIMKWADKYRTLNVRTNSDTPHDTQVAVKFGAEGIGLTRTEHMFFEGKRIISFRKLILVAAKVKKIKDEMMIADLGELTKACKSCKDASASIKQYQAALKELLPLQRNDFIGIFKALKGLPCTVRLLDPPLHEFLPHDKAGQALMAKQMKIKPSDVKNLVESLHEFNPMLGHRGCRLGITYPEVTAMQTRAIVEAAIKVKGSKPEIMIPLIGSVKELADQKAVVKATIDAVKKEKKVKKLDVMVGTMIEVPRAAMTADQVAEEAEFFSFGTNDLTQMGCGFSRDDAGKFLGEYVEKGIYEYDPFQVLDQEGIGRLVETAVTLGKKTRPKIKLGICGEHGGEPKSVGFCHKVGLNYVSCSPYRVPIARLAAAQAALAEQACKKSKRKGCKR